jgi:hypothetical protein
MRTTIDIPTPLFKRAKAAAAKEGATLRTIVVRALEALLAQPAPAKPYKFEWKGVDLGPMSEERLWELMHDQDRQWYKDFLAEERARREKKR